MRFLLLLAILHLASSQQENTVIEDDSSPKALNPQNFNPVVTASCRPSAGLMTVHVNTQAPFFGRVLSRSAALTTTTTSNPCYVDGQGQLETSVTFNMVARENDTNYCGVRFDKNKQTHSIAISVRLIKTLELAEDKQYIVTCNKATTSSPIKSPIRLTMHSAETEREVANTYYGRSYNLKVNVADNSRGFRVRDCVAFGNTNVNSIVLFDENGCPESRIVSRWRYDSSQASTTIYSMFRFENSKRLNIQCVVFICETTDCSDSSSYTQDNCPTIPAPLIGSRATYQFQRDSNDTSGTGNVLTSLTVNVLDVGENNNEDGSGKDLLVYEPEQCVGSICPRWLLWLVITLGVLFLLMLLVNLFLCSALTCTCTRTELIEKEPSIIVEDYDPYRSSWAGSQYGGSRYSLNPPTSNLSGGNGPKYH
ncbi:unnamed protein product [Orchesella dallaii]|uniref:ZP domain-containing protein n=1 Tax=Orchesella dallaii TaxID=48710 RepID=A0ABP1QR32_9HEXA